MHKTTIYQTETNQAKDNHKHQEIAQEFNISSSSTIIKLLNSTGMFHPSIQELKLMAYDKL